MLRQSLNRALYWDRYGIQCLTVVESTFSFITQGSASFVRAVVAWSTKASFLDHVFMTACRFEESPIYSRLCGYTIAISTYQRMLDSAIAIDHGHIIEVILTKHPPSRLHMRWSGHSIGDNVINAFIATSAGATALQFRLTESQVYQLYGAGVTQFHQYTVIARSYMSNLRTCITNADTIIPTPLLHIIYQYCLHEIEPRFNEPRRCDRFRVGQMEHDAVFAYSMTDMIQGTIQAATSNFPWFT